ncbi:FAD-dependent monooxygenase [Streptomyces sp. MMG1121]|uniref:FAD-dependent monooxygenase n=1 Tax=Streptomyces sp. MMG1121 TaxID=1415544 RepID=UPI002D21CB4F|nr:FAD-dependent monooxygenase [Streptomyces sp. MMG1121]
MARCSSSSSRPCSSRAPTRSHCHARCRPRRHRFTAPPVLAAATLSSPDSSTPARSGQLAGSPAGVFQDARGGGPGRCGARHGAHRRTGRGRAESVRRPPSNRADGVWPVGRLPYAKAVACRPRTSEPGDRTGAVRAALGAALPPHGRLIRVNGTQQARLGPKPPAEVPYGVASPPQYESERILEERPARRGGHLERGTELLSCAQDADGVTSVPRTASGGRVGGPLALSTTSCRTGAIPVSFRCRCSRTRGAGSAPGTRPTRAPRSRCARTGMGAHGCPSRSGPARCPRLTRVFAALTGVARQSRPCTGAPEGTPASR